MPTSVSWFREFEFNLPAALLRDLVDLFDKMGRAPLDSVSVAGIPEEQGVYQLFLDGNLTYIGKTDSEAGLNQRLARHAKKIQQRHGLDPKRVSFKAVRIFVFTAIDLEQQLIKHYSISGTAPSWNQSGFGSNDPGRERDTTTLKSGHFDLLYPIDIDFALGSSSVSGKVSVADVLRKLKDEVPYVIRFQGKGGRSRKPHIDLESTSMTVPGGPHTARGILKLVQSTLGTGWQVTVQPGYVILYKENRIYPHASPI